MCKSPIWYTANNKEPQYQYVPPSTNGISLFVKKPTQEMVDALNPFSLGKQNCLGQSLAQAETFSIVARIITKFELSVETEGKVDFFLTLKPVGAILKAVRLT